MSKTCVRLLDQKLFLNDSGLSIKSKFEYLNDKYLGYYFLNNQEYIYNLSRGAAQKNLDIDKFKLMNIPIPSIEVQNKIVEYLDMIYEEVIKLNKEKIEKIKKLNKNYLDLNLQFSKDIEIKTLGEIFNLKSGKFNSNDMDNKGDIPFYSCKADNPVGFHSTYSFDYPEYLLLISAGGSQNNMIGSNVGLGKCFRVNGKTACRANVISLVQKLNNININYINYYLNINRHKTNKNAHFTTNLGIISLEAISLMKIPIPSIEKQKEIIEYLEFNDNLIKTLEKENEINKNNAELLMKQILYK